MNNRRLPNISIITPVYNNVKFIENCITSVLNQKYPNLEYIVIDGASTDGTAEIIEKYKDKLAYFVSEKDRGQTHALNKGFARATGNVLAWLNADEEYLPGTLWKAGKAFSLDPELDFFYGQRIIVDSNKMEIGKHIWTPMHPRWHLLYRMGLLPTDASFWSASAHRLTGVLDEHNFPKLSMDYDWLLRLSFHVRKWKMTKTYLSKYTERSDRVTKLGMTADPNVAINNSYLALRRILQHHQYSKINLILGWAVSGVWCRIYERRINFPNVTYFIKGLFQLK